MRQISLILTASLLSVVIAHGQSDSVQNYINVGVQGYLQTVQDFPIMKESKSSFQYPNGSFIIAGYNKIIRKRLSAAVYSGFGFFKQKSIMTNDTTIEYKSKMIPLRAGISYALLKKERFTFCIGGGTGIHHIYKNEFNATTLIQTSTSTTYWDYSYGLGIAYTPKYKMPVKFELSVTVIDKLKFKVISLVIPVFRLK